MDHVKQVIQVFDPRSPYLAYYSKLIDQLQNCTYTTVPACIRLDEPRGNAVQPNGIKDDARGRPDLDEGVSQAMVKTTVVLMGMDMFLPPPPVSILLRDWVMSFAHTHMGKLPCW